MYAAAPSCVPQTQNLWITICNGNSSPPLYFIQAFRKALLDSDDEETGPIKDNVTTPIPTDGGTVSVRKTTADSKFLKEPKRMLLANGETVRMSTRGKTTDLIHQIMSERSQTYAATEQNRTEQGEMNAACKWRDGQDDQEK